MVIIIVCIIVFILYLHLSPNPTLPVTRAETKTSKTREFSESELRIQQEDERVLKQVHLFKADWKKFQQILEEQKIYTLYHFTDKCNLNSIKRNDGLYSWKYCEDHNFTVNRPNSTINSRSRDKDRGLENYVRLSFTRRNPMMFDAKKQNRILDPVVLEIDRILLYKKDTLFSPINADNHSVNINDNYECFRKIKFSVFKSSYLSLRLSDKKFYMAEVLIRQKVPLRFIKNIDQFA